MNLLLKISVFLFIVKFQLVYAQEDDGDSNQAEESSYEITMEELIAMMPSKEIQFLAEEDIFQDKIVSEQFNELEKLLEEKFKELTTEEYKSVGSANKAKTKVSKDIFYDYKVFSREVAYSEQQTNKVLMNILHQTKGSKNAHETVMEAKQRVNTKYLLIRDSINNRHKEVHNKFIALKLKEKVKNKGKKKGIPQLIKLYKWTIQKKKAVIQKSEDKKN